MPEPLCRELLLLHGSRLVGLYRSCRRGSERRESNPWPERGARLGLAFLLIPLASTLFALEYMASSTSTAAVAGPSSADTNPRGIPKAIFLVRLPYSLPSACTRSSLRTRSALQENVEEFIGGPDVDAEESLQSLQQVLA